MVMEAGAGWQSTVPAAGVSVTVALLAGSDRGSSVTLPWSGVPFDTIPLTGLFNVNVAGPGLTSASETDAGTFPAFVTS
jgi:hypothetical protein